MEIKINKDIQKYEHKYALGFNLRQLSWTITAFAADIVTYFTLYDKVPGKILAVIMALVTLPCAFIGFFKYHGMPAEKWFVTIIRNEFIMPECLVFKAKNYYLDLHRKNMKEDRWSEFWKKKAGSRNATDKVANESTGCNSAEENME